jgi:crotonobetainyl-CoA:carnitine CoA-transferase CaiB-like acyl-CoA transferase
MLRLPGFGATGPEAGFLSFGNTIEGMSGLTSLMGYGNGPPTMMSNALGDPVGGLNGTLAVLSGLAARESDGKGRLMECSQLEGFLPLVSEGLIEYERTRTVPARRGNERPGSVASGVFACGGDGEWIAIDIRSSEEWHSLASAAGIFGPIGAATLAEWASIQPREAAVAACLAAGVAVAPVHNEAEVLGLEPLFDPSFWQGQERAFVGYYQYPGLPIRVGGLRPEPELPAPTLGEHTDSVLRALGLAERELERLHAEGVIGTVPPG